MIYNFVIVECKTVTECLNLTEKDFFEELWKWTYVDDLWDFIEDENPDKEYLEHYIINTFIDENIFHKYEDDDTDCYAFTVNSNGLVSTYNWNKNLVDFIYNKIKNHYDKMLAN